MAWEWSHTTEAYANAYENLCDLPVNELRIIYAEWIANEHNEDDNPTHDMDLDRYESVLRDCQSMTDEALSYHIWELTRNFVTCDNGGHNAWVCPYGCHTVPFDR